MNNKGKLAELKASQYLISKNYRIVECNYSTRFGEIDIIAVKDKVIAFIEVKMRDENRIALPREFVNKSKQQKIIASSKIYLAHHKTQLQPRFDIIEVYTENNKIKSIEHLENAFQVV